MSTLFFCCKDPVATVAGCRRFHPFFFRIAQFHLDQQAEHNLAVEPSMLNRSLGHALPTPQGPRKCWSAKKAKNVRKKKETSRCEPGDADKRKKPVRQVVLDVLLGFFTRCPS